MTAPHVLAAELEGKWRTAAGYRWLNSVPGDLRVEPVRDTRWSATSPLDGDGMQRIRDLATLGLDEAAGPGEVEAAFRRLVKLHHPDRFAAAGTEDVRAAHDAFRLLRSAYERLRE